MQKKLRSKSAPSVLIPQDVTADTVIAKEDIPDPSELRTISTASTEIADDNYDYGYGEGKSYDYESDGGEVPLSDYATMGEREAAEHAATKIQAAERGRNYRKSKKGGRKKKSKRKTRKQPIKQRSSSLGGKRRRKTKKKRHIITRKNKRKRRRKKKRRKNKT